MATGPVMIRYDEGNKVQIPLEALYFLDYKGGRLIGTIPSIHQTVGARATSDAFAERDLVADFKLDLDNGPRPHFLMTTGSLGSYSAGWAPLYVFETTTNQLAVYRIQQQTVGTTASHAVRAARDAVAGQARRATPDDRRGWHSGPAIAEA